MVESNRISRFFDYCINLYNIREFEIENVFIAILQQPQNVVSVGQNTGMTNYPNYVEAVRKTLKFTYFQNYSSI